jgi:hypothetical protein
MGVEASFKMGIKWVEGGTGSMNSATDDLSKLDGGSLLVKRKSKCFHFLGEPSGNDGISNILSNP